MIENIGMMLVNIANNICIFSSLRQWIFRVSSFFSRSLVCIHNIIFIIYSPPATFIVQSSAVSVAVAALFPAAAQTLFICHNFRFWLLRKRTFVMTCKAFISTHGIYTVCVVYVLVKFRASLIRSMTE